MTDHATALIRRRRALETRTDDPNVAAAERADLAAERHAIKSDPRHFAAMYAGDPRALSRDLAAADAPAVRSHRDVGALLDEHLAAWPTLQR